MTNEAERAQAGRREGGVTLAGLRSFVAVAEAKSFSQAAQALGVSQPNVSVQIAALEQIFGMPLLSRRPRLELTEPGRELFHRARLVLSRVQELDAAMHDVRRLERGQIAVGFSTPHFAMPLIARFAQAHPSVRISTLLGNTTQLLDQLADCRVDVAIMSLTAPHPHFASFRFAAPRLCLCLPRDHPLAAASHLSPEDIRETPIVLREPGSVTRSVFESVCAAAGVEPQVRMVAGSGEAVIEAVRAGFGLGAIFDGTLGADPALVVRPFGDTPRDSGVYVVAVQESLALPPVRAFTNLLPDDASTRPGRGTDRVDETRETP
ncbi:LysR substrate-binding domain-containing protein [Aquibium sp. ELW1220]|uniref:LysR substrate-binding domain-containing protein n=1 Tax=Aquibium sp. ELW1220 TaxID=2976766 RepID=UPI0025B1DB2D|nr:LysR substrate-binding domain-containing protein [Aquibium sp. ELW1220]MDN2583803.1 LysR substrate-binding domain-containing protein [Aquibium sp. ELW1220]